ncbi:hypothetical protein [Succinivibrio dextrinosolvens]|uniref:hypothetical protein n=1 Tax=Succinivibrio dextrinosolvens TaxID=83771 RepID=UPI0019237231|nr:hypothetical protein [Succinivibrio dextrinosolvens]
MFTQDNKSKIDLIFNEIEKTNTEIIKDSGENTYSANRIYTHISSELSIRSKSLLSDMLFTLNEQLMNEDFFHDISRQNKYMELNLRKEILNKFSFSVTKEINYKTTSKSVRALKIGGITLTLECLVVISKMLMSGISPSKIASKMGPGALSLILAISIGAVLADYYLIEPASNKKSFNTAINNFLYYEKQNFIRWFDEIEQYFFKRVNEIKQTF